MSRQRQSTTLSPIETGAVIQPQDIKLNYVIGDDGELASFGFTVLGQPAVKKNNQKVSFRGRRSHKYNTAAYNRWLKSANSQVELAMDMFQILACREWKTIDFPFNLRARFFVRTFGTVDLSALYEGIQDVMKDKKMILDDNAWLLVSHDGSGVAKDAYNPRIELLLTRTDHAEWRGEPNPRYNGGAG